jgi:hypothetical protein
MSGKWLGDVQVKKYKELRNQYPQETAANKMGISVRTARRLERRDFQPSQKGPRTWRTRKDPFATYWQSEILPLLRQAPGLLATTLLEEMQRLHPGEVEPGHLRTLQRRIRDWRALEGPDQEIYFPQVHEPGRQCLSDYTDATELGITIDGQILVHKLYQFVMAYSGWRHVEVVLGGESFISLSAGLQNALWRLGGVPQEHRTDHLTAAYNNQTDHEELTLRYAALCKDYGLRATTNNLGESQENGSVEARQRTLKQALDQALMLRGYRDFSDLSAYQNFVEEVASHMNRRVQKRLAEERSLLRPLPERRSSDYIETTVRVSSNGIFRVSHTTYSAPSRLRGYPLQIRIYTQHIEAYYGSTLVVSAEKGLRDEAVIDYRHILPVLRRKPGALMGWVYRDALFPRQAYRDAWTCLQEHYPERDACRTMVGLLELAADACEAELALRLERILAAGDLPDLESLRRALRPAQTAPMDPEISVPSLDQYDQLLVEVTA